MKAQPEQVRETLAEENPDALFADGLDEALVGVARRCGQPTLAVYDYWKVVDVFMTRDGMTYEDAVEWVEFNVVGAWFGENTPVWLCRPE
jgi:hypothetical protein